MIAVVLAAGAGRRLGGAAKALLPVPNGRSFLAEIALTARQSGIERVLTVVAEPYAARVAAHAQELGCEVVRNPEPHRGMGSSVAVGFARAEAMDARGPALLWPVDHPFASALEVRRIIAALGDADAAVPETGGRGGHPIAVHRRLWAALSSCGALPMGARSVLRAPDTRVVRLAMGSRAVLRDVDTPGDLPARRFR